MSFITDPIADMLTRIRNAGVAKLETVDIPYSKIKAELARILNEEGYIRNFEIRKEGNINGIVRVHLKYSKDRKSSISGIRRVSNGLQFPQDEPGDDEGSFHKFCLTDVGDPSIDDNTGI